MKKKIIPLLIMGILFIKAGYFSPINADENRWSTSGPYNANVLSIAIHPIDNQIIYIGTVENGIYKTTDGGGSWMPMNNEDLPTNTRVIRFHPSAPDTMYAATVSGFYKSSDMGQNWSLIVLPDGWQYEIRSFVIPHTQPNIIIIGSTHGTHYRSTNGGIDWTSMDLPLVVAQKHILDPVDTNRVYLVTQSAPPQMSIFRSDDLGISWENIHNDLDTSIFGYDMAIDPVNPNTLYFCGSRSSDTTGACMSKSTDGGEHWFDITPDNLIEPYIGSVAISPFDHNTLLICTGANGVLQSHDGGHSWFEVNNGLTNRMAARILIDSLSGIYYLGTHYDGIYRSIDEGENWEKISYNISNSRCRDISINLQSSDTIFVASANGIYRSTNGALDWEYLDFLFPDYNRFASCVKVDPIHSEYVYAGFYPRPWGPEYVGIARSTNCGESWDFIYDGFPSFTGYNKLDVAFNDANRHRIFLASTSGLYYSDDFALTWSREQSLPDDVFYALNISAANSELVYTGSSTLYKSTDMGDTWESLPGPPGDNFINEITTDPLNPYILYCCRNRDGIYKSIDGGYSWQDIGNNLPYVEDWFTVSGVAINPRNPDAVFANVFRNGIFLSNNGGENWEEFNYGLQTNYAKAITIIDPVDTNRVYLATDQQSVWSFTRIQTSVGDEVSPPVQFITLSNYPNPFNAATVINFSIYNTEHITLDIYNLLGQHVETIYDGLQQAGHHTITWDASAHPSGVYFARLETADRSESIRMVLLK